MAANWRSCGNRMLYSHRSMQKIWCNCSNPASFHNSSTGGGSGLLLGGGCFKKAAMFLPIRRFSSSSPPVSPRSLSSSPLLMVPPGVNVVDHHNSESSNKNNEDYFHFFSLSEQSQFRVRRTLSVPWQRELLMPNGAFCVGSSHGWLVFNQPHNCHPYLYNPLIDSPHFPYIPLPSIETIPSVLGFRSLKSDHSSPSPSLITQFINLIHEDCNSEEYTYEEKMSPERACRYFVQRLVMSSAPTVPCYSSSLSKPQIDGNCTIMAIHSGGDEIGFCKPGDERWTMLDVSGPMYADIIYCSKDQRFFALRFDFSIEAWDLRDPSRPQKQFFHSPDFCEGKIWKKIRESYIWDPRIYLVESCGDILLLCRFIALSRIVEVENKINDDEWENYFIHDDDAYWTMGFDVHKFDSDNNKWERVECLGDRAMFVGYNNSFSLSTRDYPELVGNSIYFADDNLNGFNNTYGGHDNGVFSLEDNRIKPYYPSREKVIGPHPVWVAPNTL
ncbi:uncharacterized protein LOC132313353 [Cornus florida]|uniref:uncharacterized protein LOC132313353 n=1 Tax=Cornus florida TaxID=4283 RepID=UPI0028A0363E|nr:uncharacterized protein LOC132313353 [Cornus florida]